MVNGVLTRIISIFASRSYPESTILTTADATVAQARRMRADSSRVTTTDSTGIGADWRWEHDADSLSLLRMLGPVVHHQGLNGVSHCGRQFLDGVELGRLGRRLDSCDGDSAHSAEVCQFLLG